MGTRRKVRVRFGVVPNRSHWDPPRNTHHRNRQGHRRTVVPVAVRCHVCGIRYVVRIVLKREFKTLQEQ
jgi:hypothetical protein